MKSFIDKNDELNIKFENEKEEEHFITAVGYILESMGEEIEDYIEACVTEERHSLDRAIDLEKEIEKVSMIRQQLCSGRTEKRQFLKQRTAISSTRRLVLLWQSFADCVETAITIKSLRSIALDK